MKNPQDFQEAVIKNNITDIVIGRCSICNSTIGFAFQKGNPNAYFDGSCDCNSVFGPRPIGWQDIADHYNISNNKEQLDKDWGFYELDE